MLSSIIATLNSNELILLNNFNLETSHAKIFNIEKKIVTSIRILNDSRIYPKTNVVSTEKDVIVFG